MWVYDIQRIKCINNINTKDGREEMKFTLIRLVHSTWNDIIVLEGDGDKLKMCISNSRADCKMKSGITNRPIVEIKCNHNK